MLFTIILTTFHFYHEHRAYYIKDFVLLQFSFVFQIKVIALISLYFDFSFSSYIYIIFLHSLRILRFLLYSYLPSESIGSPLVVVMVFVASAILQGKSAKERERKKERLRERDRGRDREIDRKR